jgi:hypothetical protein
VYYYWNSLYDCLFILPPVIRLNSLSIKNKRIESHLNVQFQIFPLAKPRVFIAAKQSKNEVLKLTGQGSCSWNVFILNCGLDVWKVKQWWYWPFQKFPEGFPPEVVEDFLDVRLQQKQIMSQPTARISTNLWANQA